MAPQTMWKDSNGNENGRMGASERPCLPKKMKDPHRKGRCVKDTIDRGRQDPTKSPSRPEKQTSQKTQKKDERAPHLTPLQSTMSNGFCEVDIALDPGVALFEDALLINIEQMSPSDTKNEPLSMMQSSRKVGSQSFEDNYRLNYHGVPEFGTSTSFESWALDHEIGRLMDWDESLQMFRRLHSKSDDLEEVPAVVEVEVMSMRYGPQFYEMIAHG